MHATIHICRPTVRKNGSVVITMLRNLQVFVCLLLSSACTELGVKETICPQGCECTDLSAHCRGDNNSWVNAVNNLPSATEHFTFTIFTGSVHRKVQIDLSANLGRLQNLTEFRINTPGDDFEQDYTLVYTSQSEPIGPTVFCDLEHLKALHLNAKIDVGKLTASAIVCLKKLESS